MKRILVLATLAIAAIGCHGQLPPTQHTVTLTITPQGCGTGTPTCTYVASKDVLTAGTLTCPAPTGTNYTPINASSPATTTTFVDTTSAGETVCEVAQTLQSGAVSPASNTVGPFVVLPNPLAPSITGQSAMNDSTETLDSGKKLAQATHFRSMLKPNGKAEKPQLVAQVN